MGLDPPMKALIIGGSGQVGSHLSNKLTNLGKSVTITHHRQATSNSIFLDIVSKDKVHQLISEFKPTHIYLPAAATNVDECEKNPDSTFPVNVTGVQNVVEAANLVNARLIYFSTDYIFDGVNGPYDESEPPNPICEYGKQKVYAEHCVLSSCKDFLIIRTTVVYGWEQQQKNFVIRLIAALREKKEVQVPIDQIGSPTFARNLAEATIYLAESQERGIINVTGPEIVSRYEFACEAARVFGVSEEFIKPVETQFLGQIAKRPLNLGLVVDKAVQLLDIPLLGYRDGLRKMVEQTPSSAL